MERDPLDHYVILSPYKKKIKVEALSPLKKKIYIPDDVSRDSFIPVQIGPYTIEASPFCHALIHLNKLQSTTGSRLYI